MRTLILLALLLVACGNDDPTGPGAGPYAVGLDYFTSTALGTDSIRDSLVVIVGRLNGGLEPGVWLRFSASSGEVSRAVIQTNDRASAGITWTFPIPAPGATESLHLCLARTQTGACESAGDLVSHTGQ